MKNKHPIKIIICQWQTHQEQIKPIRQQVFIDEQNVPVELEWDGADEQAWHFLALENGNPVGTARLLNTGQIGRMSVLKPYRRTGVGTALLQKAEATARHHSMPQVFLHAQTYIQHFYQQQGYQPIGEVFMDAGIPHIEMVKVFSP